MVYCLKLKKELEGLSRAPYPGELGEKILTNISEQAWKMWIAHQTILINEYRLSMADKAARDFLKQEMQKFLFDEHAELPTGFVPQNK